MVRITNRRGRNYFCTLTPTGEPDCGGDPRTGMAREPLPAAVEGVRMSDPTEDLWNALTSGNTRKIVEGMRRAEEDKTSLQRDWEDELRRTRRHRSWEDQAADDAGVPRFGPI